MLNRKMKPIAAAVGAAFAASLAPAVAADSSNAEAAGTDPFETRVLEGVVFAKGHLEGGCGEDREKPADAEGEGNCGEGKGEGNCGEGNCGEGAEEGAEEGKAESDEAEDDEAAEE